METYSNLVQIPLPTAVQWHQTFYGLSIDQIPAERFSFSGNLQSEGWPDYSVKALADWQSSVTPSPNPPIDDCCLVVALPSVSLLITAES